MFDAPPARGPSTYPALVARAVAIEEAAQWTMRTLGCLESELAGMTPAKKGSWWHRARLASRRLLLRRLIRYGLLN